jgi:hypothetical protein
MFAVFPPVPNGPFPWKCLLIQVDKMPVSVHHISYNFHIGKQNGGTMQTTISSKFQILADQKNQSCVEFIAK